MKKAIVSGARWKRLTCAAHAGANDMELEVDMDMPEYHSINKSKRNFDAIYNDPDPRLYYETLNQFDYVIPSEAKPVFKSVIENLKSSLHTDHITVLDLGCSYGVNGALLKHDLEMKDLYEHYAESEGLSPKEIAEKDRVFFEEHLADENLEIIGLDVAERAVRYAVATGIIDDGVVADLEAEDIDQDALSGIGTSDLITSTGCVGYVSETTFDHLVNDEPAENSPWVASFVLRMFPYDAIEKTLSDAGLTTEKLDNVTFPQRQFASQEEQSDVVQELERLGIDPAPEIKANGYLAEFYLSRPAVCVHDLPLAELLTEQQSIAHRRPPRDQHQPTWA